MTMAKGLDNDTVSINTVPTNPEDTLEQLAEKKRYQLLTDLLLSKERHRLQQLEDYLNNPDAQINKIVELLPEAISHSDLATIHHALGLDSTIKKTVIESIEDDSTLYAKALYPVIFPAIKKSISEAFKEMLQTVNVAIEQSLSLDRVSWHIEAMRSGVPYREIVLRNTLSYQVEQVFLIHRETGLLLRHSSLIGLDTLRDSDAVSSMLTAIQDFIKDSFSLDDDSHLDTVEIGEYTVFLTRGSSAVLACVIRGIPPVSLRGHFEETLHSIHHQYNNLLKGFDGDSEPLEITEPQLQACLLSEKKQINSANKKIDPKYYLIPLFVAVIFMMSYWGYGQWDFKQRTQAYINTLYKTNGVVITSTQYDGKHLKLNGLYDPLLKPSDYLIADSFKLSAEELTSYWNPYQSLEPKFIIHRAKDLLQAPDNVKIVFNNNTLTFIGITRSAWIEKLAKYSPTNLAVNKIDISQLTSYQQRIIEILQPPKTIEIIINDRELTLIGTASLSWLASLNEKLLPLNFLTQYNVEKIVSTESVRLTELMTEIEQFYVYFNRNEFTLNAEQQQRIPLLFDSLTELFALNKQLNHIIAIVITGYTDGLGSKKYNQLLAQKRAKSFMNFLKQNSFTHNLPMIITAISSKKQMTQVDLLRKANLTFIVNNEIH